MRNQLTSVTYQTPMKEVVGLAKQLGIKWIGVNKTELILHVNGAVSRVNRGKVA